MSERPDTVAVAPGAAQGPQVASSRLLATLAIAGALAGLLIVLVHRATQPAIQAHKAEVLRQAIHEVLKDPERYETLYVHGGSLLATPPDGVKPSALPQVYRGFDAQGRSVGFAIPASGPGFQDTLKLIFGYDPERARLLGMKVLESKETPGLGDKIEKDPAFTGQFDGAEPPLIGVKGAATDDPSRVETITGATISSRAVIGMINTEVQRLGPILRSPREHVRERGDTGGQGDRR